LCLRTIDLFCAVFGSVAGDMALVLGAWDGVFLSGGLVPRLLDELKGKGFRARFEAKGRYAGTLAQVPTAAVVHPQPGLLGAAALACDIASERAR
jgi:glucokinase